MKIKDSTTLLLFPYR